RHTVPDPNVEKAIFWVHQFKLLEGIDDPRFRLLALYEELRTTRSFVQQVGRVIRNPQRLPNETAYVMDHSNGRQKELWGSFLSFDQRVRKEGVTVADFGKKVVEDIVKAQPDIVYIDGRFRSQFNLECIEPVDELSLSWSVNVFRKTSGFDFVTLCLGTES